MQESCQVLVFSFQKFFRQSIQVHLELVGHQMGEYFGSTLCVLDLNADGLDDLVVGAPHHSLPGSAAGDEGRVYAYLSHADGQMLTDDNIAITGSSYPTANFGTAMVSIGDINMDGYQDLAVGAPYEDNGAIYIYHGSRDGMKPHFSQRILATDITSQDPLSGFGFSISPGLDIDGNHYNDIVVGAYSSDQAVVLRSRPVVNLHATLKSSVVMISLVDLAFNFSVCASFSGHFLPNELGITATVKVDPELNRAVVDGQTSIFSYNTTVANQEQHCKGFSFKIKPGIDDIFNPTNISLDLSLQDTMLAAGITAGGGFCQSCLVVDPDDRSTVMSVLFDNGCGSHTVCQTDLAVHVAFINIIEPFILDPERPLKLAVSVESSKEPAYQSRFTLETSGEVTIVKMPSTCQKIPDTSVLCLRCMLGLKSLTSVSEPAVMELELDMSKVDAVTRQIVFSVTAESHGVEQTPFNNTELLELRIFTDSHPVLVGYSNPATVYFSEQLDDIMTFSHIYEVRTSGPSPMTNVDLEFLVPTTIVVEGNITEVIHIDSVLLQLGSYLLNCTWQQKAATNVAAEGNSNMTLQLSCEQEPTSCVVVTCQDVGPFPTRYTVATVYIRLQAISKTLSSVLEKKKIIQLSTMGKAIYTLPENAIKQNISNWQEVVEAAAGATSVLIADIAAEKVKPWILLLAILAGLLILLLLVLGMYKAGFFKRKRPANYGELREETVVNKDECEGASPEDSNPHDCDST